MASTSSHNGIELTPESIESFASSLKLSSHNKTLVLDVLQDLSQATVDIADAVLANQKRISASCAIASLALGDNVLLKGPAIQQAVSESWQVSQAPCVTAAHVFLAGRKHAGRPPVA